MGAPLGNQNAAKAKRWEAAICRALEAWPNPPDSTDCNELMRGINQAAFEFVKKLMSEKDIQFFREMGDRIDGKPSQAIVGAEGGPVQVEHITRVIVDPSSQPA